MTNRTTDPRARQLAEAVHRLAREKATKLPAWTELPLSEREKAATEARLWLRAAAEAGIVAAVEAEPPLSPDYEHPACGFHWHGKDGMDIPVRDGEPVCPRCELVRVEKLLAHRERRCEELRAESKRRGRNVLEHSEKNRVLERKIDGIRGQLGAEILRADEAEAVLDDVRRIASRLANHAAGFQDVLDESDRGPWGRTVGADVAELSAAIATARAHTYPNSDTPRAYESLDAVREALRPHLAGGTA